MDKITFADFRKGETVKHVHSAMWQWSYGQVLRIQGLNLPSAVEIHFSLDENAGEAVRRIGITDSGVTDVVIPDFILEGQETTKDHYQAYAFVFLSDEEAGKTTHKIVMKIKTRPRPEGTAPSDETTFGAIMEAVREIAERTGGTVSDEQIQEAVNKFLKDNPIDGLTKDELAAAIEDYFDINPVKVEKENYFADFGVTTYDEILEAIDKGQHVLARYENKHYALSSVSTTTIVFETASNNIIKSLEVSSKSVWSNSSIELQTVGSRMKTMEGVTDRTDLYPSVKAVADYTEKKMEQKMDKPSTAAVGQMVVVKKIDENGKPIEFEAMNVPEGGSGATVTKESIKSALGYTPANESKVNELSGQKVDVSALGLGYGADGKVYILINGVATGSGIVMGTAVVDDIRIYDIVSYYQEPTQAVVDELNALGDEYVSFVAVTDTHVGANSNNSQNIIRYILKNTKANRLFHLGDIADEWSVESFETYFTPFKNCISQVFFSFGNHEWYGETTVEDVALIYDELLADKYYLRGNPEEFYYYFDDTERKIRYLVINTSPQRGNGIVTTKELAWIEESVQLPTSDWKLIAFGHYDIMPNDPITDEWNSPSAEGITNALKTTNGVFVGYFCGHEHHDRIVTVEDSFYQITLLNDSCTKDTEYEEITNPTRTAGTVSEQAVSIVSINTTTGDVTIRRIGAGENMSYNYLDIVEEPDEPDVPEDVTLTIISATYTGGEVPVGTSVNSLTGITVIAHFSDGSTANVTGYTLSGEIVEGSNTITVSYQGKTTTFAVTGIAESGGGDNTGVSNGTTWTDGVPYDIVKTKIDGIYLENGVEIPYNGWSATDYLYCFGAYKCECSESWFLNPIYGAFYDEDKNYISNLTGGSGNISEFIIPNNAYYFRVSCITNNFALVTITPYATE